MELKAQSNSSKLYAYLTTAMQAFPHRTISDENSTLSSRQFLRFSKDFSSRLTASKYGILCRSELNAAKAVFSCIAAGCTAVPLSYRYGQKHIDRIIEHTRLSFIITDENGKLEIKQIAYEKSESEDLRDVSFILCTSGTTGLPKGAMLTESNIISNLKGIEQYFYINQSDRILIARPLYHCAVMVGEFLVSLRKGSDIVFSNDSFNPGCLDATVRQEKITVVCGTPTMFHHFCRAAKRRTEPLPLRVIAVSGECMSGSTAALLCNTLPGTAIFHVYGLTEAGPRVSYLDPDLFSQYPASVGIPIEGTSVKIESGELLVRGESVMRGYYADPEGTARAFEGPWLRTGDLADLTDGRIVIKGRKDDLIIRSGMNIYPREIEDAVKADSRIQDAMAFGVSDTGVTQKIHLHVVSENLTGSELVRICQKALPPYQVPDVAEIVGEISRNASGKKVRPKL